jgi:hypothetical protein
MNADILIVEDTLGIAEAVQHALSLSGDGAFRVDLCESGEEALRRLHEKPFDLLITDLRLPGIDGLELLSRARQVHPSMRTLLVTAYGSAEVETRAQELGSRYLPKPFRLRDLLDRVDSILSEPLPEIPAAEERIIEPAIPAGPMVERARKKVKNLMVLACDLDGTLAENGQVDPQTWDALRQARLAGLVLILVTGRTLDSFISELPFAELCEAIVAENGAVIYFPRRDLVMTPFGGMDPGLLQRLQALNVPLERGIAIASSRVPYDQVIFKALQEMRTPLAVEYNREAFMLLPPGASKGQGLLLALQELGYSPHNVLACGDAENDRSLFQVAELSVAVANARSALKEHADTTLEQPDGEGVRILLRDLLAGKRIKRRARPGRRIVLGNRMSGGPLYLDPSILVENNLGIFGSSGSGKSWLAGLLVEEMLKQKYQVCVIDPEGDYRGLGMSPNTLLLGGPQKALPSVEDVVNLCEWQEISLILDLSMYSVDDRIRFVDEFLTVLRGLRTRRGRPHFILVDEVQLFCPSHDVRLIDLLLDSMQWGGFTIVSYRLSLIPPRLLNALEGLLLTRLRLPEELSTLQPHLDRLRGGEIRTGLPNLPQGYAYLLHNPEHGNSSVEEGAIKFRVGLRSIPHVRHLYKYLRSPVPAWKAFHFHTPAGSSLDWTAGNLWEFRNALAEAPVESIAYHLYRGDFEHWLGEVIHDEELVRRVHKVVDRKLEGEALRRALLEVVIARYNELDAYA